MIDVRYRAIEIALVCLEQSHLIVGVDLDEVVEFGDCSVEVTFF